MQGSKLLNRLLLVPGLLALVTQLALAQSGVTRPVNLQIPDQGQVQLYKGSYALVIGASDYQDNSWGDLRSVREDVAAVRKALGEKGFLVKTLLDPTSDTLIDQINDFIDQYGYEQDNRLLFYYAGHGYTQERNGRVFGYLVPVDAPKPYDNERVFFQKSIKMEQILSWAKRIESKHILFVFDSFFSDSVLQSSEVTFPDDISYQTPKPVRQFISSGSASNTFADKGVFSPLFIRGINGKADLNQDGYVTGTELGMYLQQQAPQFHTGQTPYYGKLQDPDSEGNFVFETISSNRPKLKIMKLYIGVDDFLADLDSHQTSWKTIKLPDRYLVYMGEVRNGLPNGKGTYTDPDGFNYVGELKNGKLHGRGMLVAPHGDQYVGQYKDGKLHGKGTYTWSNGKRYVGEWKEGKANGQGTLTWPDGREYVGALKDNKFGGLGSFTFPDGRAYAGEWKNGLLNGQGNFNHSDGRAYAGEWKSGKLHGQGTFTWPDGESYVGAFKDNKFHWQGTHLWPNGEKYVGNHRDGLADGQGTFTWPDGERYVGNHKDNLAHGQGTHTWPDGRFLRGVWEGGEFIGERPVQRNQPNKNDVWRPKAAQNKISKIIDCEDCDHKKANFTKQQVLLKNNALKPHQQRSRRLPIPKWSLAEQYPIKVTSTLLSR